MVYSFICAPNVGMFPFHLLFIKSTPNCICEDKLGRVFGFLGFYILQDRFNRSTVYLIFG